MAGSSNAGHSKHFSIEPAEPFVTQFVTCSTTDPVLEIAEGENRVMPGLVIFASRSALVADEPGPPVRVGSKVFTESVILGEIAQDLIRDAGVRRSIHRRELGGTQVLFHALEADELDVYAEYTGTISGEILAGQNIRDEDALRAALAERGVGMSRPLGFNDTYAIGMREAVAARLGISSLSDLQAPS